MSPSPSPTFCALPWAHIHVRSERSLAPCCLAEELEDTVLPNTPGGLNEARNSAAYRGLRRQMVGGREPSACRACFDLERRGLRSARLEANEKYAGLIPSFLAQTSGEGDFSRPLLSADLRVQNSCNLQCRMCSPDNSKILTAEWTELGLSWDQGAARAYWESDEEWMEFFASNPGLEHLTLAGGEPFLTPRIKWVVEYLVNSGRAARLNIKFHTNLTAFTDATVAQLGAFRSAEIMVSLEGPEPVNSYIRYPSVWRSIEKNIRRLDEFARFPFVSARLCVTVQAYNILALAEVLEFSSSLRNFDVPYLTVLTDPPELRMSVLPSAYRELARRRLRSSIAALAGREDLPAQSRLSLRAQLEDIVARLSTEESAELLPAFRARTRAMDAYRKHSIHDFIPELASLVVGDKGDPESR